MPLPGIRATFALIAAGCLGLIVTALYLQEILGLHPCPLCITQRIFVILVGLTALIAAIHMPARTGRLIYASLGALFAIIGAGVSARHVWIQHLPADQVPACGPGLEYMFETFPIMEALALLFQGDGNCAEVVWQFLGLSIPSWTLIAFVGLLALNLWQGLRARA